MGKGWGPADLIPYLFYFFHHREVPLCSYLDRIKGHGIFSIPVYPIFRMCLNFPSTIHFVDLAHHQLLSFDSYFSFLFRLNWPMASRRMHVCSLCWLAILHEATSPVFLLRPSEKRAQRSICLFTRESHTPSPEG